MLRSGAEDYYWPEHRGGGGGLRAEWGVWKEQTAWWTLSATSISYNSHRLIWDFPDKLHPDRTGFLTVYVCEGQSVAGKEAAAEWRWLVGLWGHPWAGPDGYLWSPLRVPPRLARGPGFHRTGRTRCWRLKRAFGWWCVTRTHRCWWWRRRTCCSRWHH